jgi:AraC-like DNA-binding protein
MTVQPPCAELRPFVRELFITESVGGYSHVLLPDTAVAIAFRFQGSGLRQGVLDLPRTFVSGLYDAARTLERPANTSVLVAKFRETGIHAFLREPVDGLFGTTAALDNFFLRSQVHLVEEQLAETSQNSERFLIVQRFLLGQLRSKPAGDGMVAALTEHIKHAKGDVRVAQLVRATGVSQSAIERRFRKILGISPKGFASIVRLRNTVQLQGLVRNLTELAYRAGYSDQSHFIKDFRRFTSQSPADFFRLSSFC